jgi:putative transposase
MPRRPRAEVAPGLHHVYARGNDRREVFRDDDDRYAYLRLLGRVVPRQRWRCLSYCLIPNHVHLLVETVEPNLGDGMRRLHGEYAQTFNARHGRSGHVFQGRYGAKLVTTERYAWWVVRYIARNPVPKLCATPVGWPWGSHAALVGHAPPPSWLDDERLLELFASAGGDPRQRYLEQVESEMDAAGFEPATSRV